MLESFVVGILIGFFLGTQGVFLTERPKLFILLYVLLFVLYFGVKTLTMFLIGYPLGN